MASGQRKAKARPGSKRAAASKKSAYARGHRLSEKKLEFLLKAADETLREHASGAASGRAAKTLAKEGRRAVGHRAVIGHRILGGKVGGVPPALPAA